MESYLRIVLSQFSRRFRRPYLGLTPRELQIANLIRDGKSTKDIAELLHISPRAIVFHRQNLREKLGLKADRANLRSWLMSLS